MKAVLSAVGIVRRFERREIVARASLTIDPGEWVSLMGPSGCGKTTLLQVLGLLDRPDDGSVHFGPEDAWRDSDADRAALRLARIGFVFQQNNLLEWMSARENVALPAWRLGGSRDKALARADELLAGFGLSPRAHAMAKQLSVGEAQRVAIARAMVNRPAVILADEPTGSLDSASTAIVLAALARARDDGAALLVVTHDPNVAAAAQRRLSMQDGHLLSEEDAAAMTAP